MASSLRPAGPLYEYANPLTWRTFFPKSATLQNYGIIFDSLKFGRALANSMIVACATVLLSALVAWPIVAFCMRGRRGPESPPRIARLMAWIMGLLFVLFFICVLQNAANPRQFAFGVPSLLKMALWLPLLAIPLFAATAWFSIRAWNRKYWSLVGRLHYSLVSAAGLTLLGWLYYWNLLGFHY